SISPPRTNTTASGRGFPPLPSMTVAPTNAMRFGPCEPHAATAARTRTAVLARITRRMIVEDLPPGRPALEDKSERPAGGRLPSPEENEPGCQQRVAISQRPRGDLLEPQAVPRGAGGEARSVARSDEVPSVAGMTSLDERRGGITGVVAHEAVEVATVPVVGG